MDNITVHNFIVSSDKITAAYAYLVLGSWIGVISSLFFALFFGKKVIDHDFHRIIFKNRKMHLLAFISGAISAGSTLFLLLGNQLGDPTMLIALGNTVVIYTMLYDLKKKEVNFKQIFLPAILVISGGFLAASGSSLPTSLWSFLFVVVISNGLAAISEIIEQSGSRASDSVDLFIWRFFWLAVCGTILALSLTFFQHTTLSLVILIRSSLKYIPWILFTMLFVFLGVGLKLTAKKQGSVSIVLLALSAQMILGYPITIIGNIIHPNLFGELPMNTFIWLLRISGMVILTLGIFSLKRSEKVSASKLTTEQLTI
ncbi:hypothetical protein M1615_02170 [Patescibacteria group bacterium]|nr:hypothetical protein [Patescibacteria group bacterium]